MKEFNCPNCGAALTVRAADYIAKCEFCGSVIDLERSSSEISAERAREIAQQIREYDNTKRKISEAADYLKEKNNQYSEIIERKKNVVPNIWMKAVVIWIVCIAIFGVIMKEMLYAFDVLPVILDVIFAGTIGYFIINKIQGYKQKSILKYNDAEKNALLEKEKASKNLSELSANFDENFLPANIRDDTEAISFIINSLETERAYTLRQAMGLWEDRKFYQKQIDESVSKNITAQNNTVKSENKEAEAIGAFAGAALGALGGTVAKNAIKEVMKHI